MTSCSGRERTVHGAVPRARCLLPTTALLLPMTYLWSAQSLAQTAPESSVVAGPLVTLVETAPVGTFDSVEKLSAIANQASYNSITANPSAAIYCNPGAIAPTTQCPTNVFTVFKNLRVLVQTANELLNNGGATLYSLSTDSRGLGFALRWTAATSLNAPGSVATQFANGQVTSVASRITALRFGASGFNMTGVTLQQDGHPSLVVSAPRALGGGASADSDIGIASRWGGFFNGSFGWGYREPSVLENAFAFDSRDFTLGADYRFSRRMVIGLAAGYTDQRIDFDSRASVAGGGIHADGYSATLYGYYEWDGPYVSASAGWQHLSYITTRLITYPSNNIAVPSVDATARGETHSNALLTTLNLGWAFNFKAATVEPSLTANYRDATLAGFSESSQNNPGSVGPNGQSISGQAAGFDLNYASQQIRILDTSAGLRLQYVLQSRYGALLPYAKAAYHHEFDGNIYSVTSSYNAISSGGAQFVLPSDPPGNSYFEFTGGFSAVFKHGIQGFVQFQTSSRLDLVTSRQISAGIRGEF